MAPDDLDDLLFGDTETASTVLLPATFHYIASGMDDTLYDVGVRLRGNTSLTAPKKSFKIDFNDAVPGQDFYGLEKMNLNANQNDPSLLRAALSWHIIRETGLPGSRTSFVRLEINGDYMGLYVNTEHFDDDFIKARYQYDQGNLYKCLWPATLHDLGSDPDLYKYELYGRRVYELKTNTDVDDYTDLAHFIDVLNNASDADFPCAIEQVFNVPSFLQTLALDVLTGNWDGYAGNKNNFYLYLNPQNGRFEYIPYDLDNTWGIDWIGQNWAMEDPYDWAAGTDFGGDFRPLYDRILAVDLYRTWFTHYLRKLSSDWFDMEFVDNYVNSALALLTDPIDEDPYYPLTFGFTSADFQASAIEAWGGHVEYGVQTWAAARVASLESQLDAEAPVLFLLSTEDNGPTLGGLHIRATVESAGLMEPTDPLELTAWVEGSPHPMYDDGAHDDDGPGDGVWGATIDVDPAWTSAAYQVQASSGAMEDWLPCIPATAVVGVEPSPLLINELMSRNDTTTADDLGEFDDWCELYNAGETAINLAGKFLTDNTAEPDKFPLPSEILAPGDWILYWLDNDPEQGPGHAPFKLSGSGESLALYESSSTPGEWQLLDLIEFGASDPDISLGRITDGDPQWVWFSAPTPDGSNNGAGVLGSNELTGQALQIWPNPTSGNTVRFSSARSGRLCTTQGRVVRSFHESAELDVSGLKAGVYLLRTNLGEVSRILKL